MSALALITAYLHSGRDVVLPQLVLTPAEADRLAGRRQLLDLAADRGWTVVDATDREVTLDALDRAATEG